jgi:hypothetical protein
MVPPFVARWPAETRSPTIDIYFLPKKNATKKLGSRFFVYSPRHSRKRWLNFLLSTPTSFHSEAQDFLCPLTPFFLPAADNWEIGTRVTRLGELWPIYDCLPGLPDFAWHNIPKRKEIYQIAIKLPNGHKIYIPHGRNIYQTAIEYTNLFNFKALQIYPNTDFGLENIPSGNFDYFAQFYENLRSSPSSWVAPGHGKNVCINFWPKWVGSPWLEVSKKSCTHTPMCWRKHHRSKLIVKGRLTQQMIFMMYVRHLPIQVGSILCVSDGVVRCRTVSYDTKIISRVMVCLHKQCFSECRMWQPHPKIGIILFLCGVGCGCCIRHSEKHCSCKQTLNNP